MTAIVRHRFSRWTGRGCFGVCRQTASGLAGWLRFWCGKCGGRAWTCRRSQFQAFLQRQEDRKPLEWLKTFPLQFDQRFRFFPTKFKRLNDFLKKNLTFPTLALTSKLKFFKTYSPFWEYFAEIFLNIITPCSGQVGERFFSTFRSLSRERSLGRLPYSTTRSTEVIWFSSSAVCLSPQLHIPMRLMACVIASPTLAPTASKIVSANFRERFN